MDQEIKYNSLSVFLGGGCNLNCSYCFVDKENLKKFPPNISKLKKSIDFFLEHSLKQSTINFTGGEPLVYWKVLRKLIEYLERKRKRIFIVVSTNGTLLDWEKFSFFQKNGVGLSISLDGPFEINDLYRVFRDKKDSVFEMVWRNIKNLNKERIKIASVFTPRTVSYITENVEFFLRNGFYQIDFYPEIFSLWTENDLNLLKKSFDEFSQFYIKLNPSSIRSHSGLQVPFINKMFNKTTENFCCQKLNLGPGGNFYLCDKIFSFFDKRRKKYIVGDGEKGIDEAKREKMLREAKKEILKLTTNSCIKCPWQNYCFCPIGLYLWSKENKKDFQKHFQTFCKISKIYTSVFLKICGKREN
ncbi:radical SAM protein [Patescibacteria group bacterium]|nr:radical SAM protein [Patescibacteria group bacterium]